jgi:exonuclease III
MANSTKNMIMQWNCRGLRANFDELQILTKKFSPSVVCLQETMLKNSDTPNLRGYQMYSHISNTGARASGGSSIIVNNRTPKAN